MGRALGTRLLITVALVWIMGSGFLIYSARPDPRACQWPFMTYAVLWPVFVALPHGGKEEFVRLSFMPC